MTGSERTLYPMLGVGAFFVMFWVGFVVGYELGLNCWLFPLNAFLFACSGAWFVARLQVADEHPGAYRRKPSRPRPHDAGESTRPVLTPGIFVPTNR